MGSLYRRGEKKKKQLEKSWKGGGKIYTGRNWREPLKRIEGEYSLVARKERVGDVRTYLNHILKGKEGVKKGGLRPVSLRNPGSLRGDRQ